jgi:hypothetical protein
LNDEWWKLGRKVDNILESFIATVRSLRKAKNQDRAGRNVDLEEVLAAIPFHWGGKVLARVIDPTVATKPLVVAVKHNLVLAASLHADTVVDK